MNHLLELARDLLDTTTKYKSNHLTFITHRTTIITVGRNYEDRTHVLANRFGYIDGRIHSELDAVIKFSRRPFRLSSCRFWNVRIDRWDNIRLSKPCPRCQRMLSSFGARRIFYSTDEGVFDQ